MTAPRIAIIGGGITGLTAAYRLIQNGVDVTIYEASGDLGGLASGFTLAGHPVEKAYHFLYKTDEYILALVEELGLSGKLAYNPSSVSTYYDGVLYPMMTPVDLVKFSPISFLNRIRAGVTVLWLQRVRNWRKLSTITALDWLRRWAGRQVTDVIWEPLLRGKFDRYYDKVTMSWLWGRVKQRVDSRDAKVGGEALGYFEGGFKIIIDALLEKIRAGGVDIRLNTRVASLNYAEGAVVVSTAIGEERYDRVLATVPSNVLASMISSYEAVDPAYFAKLRSIDYLDACVQVFATPQKFTPYYWHNINTPNAPFVVFLSLTNLVGSERFGGLNIYYVGDYVPAEHPYMSMDAGELKQRWYGELQKIFPEFDPAQVVDDGVFRLRNAQHIVDIGFEEMKLLPHETPCPGVLMCNFSQIYPMDRGTNYAVRDGDRMAERLLASLAGRQMEEAGPLLTISGGARSEPKKKVSALSRVSAALIALALLGVLGGAGLGFFGGFEVAMRKFPPYELMAKIDRKLGRWFGEGDQVATTLATALIDLDTDLSAAPVPNVDPDTGERLEGVGGGVTSFGADVLILPYSGKVFAARSGSEVRETNVRAPRNNRAAYLAVADDPTYAERFRFHRNYVRYNDILYYSAGASHGLLASYTEFHADHLCYTNTLARLPFPAGARSINEVSAGPDDWTILHRTSPCLPLKDRFYAIEGHLAGGRLAFVPPATVYMSSGDFHWDGMRSNTELIAQNPTAEYGKVLAIDLATGASRIVSMGNRNPQGIVVDNAGRIFALEHGPRGGDEINLISEGANYGWPLESYGTTYDRLRIPSAVTYGRHDHYPAPLFAWVPSVATTGITLIQGFNEAWDGDLLAGSLVGQSLYRLRLQGDRIVYSETIPIGQRVRDVHQHTDGRIVVWTDHNRLLFLSPARRPREEQFVAQYITRARMSGALRDRLSQAVETCGQCHSFATGDNTNAPSLARVYGRDIASTSFVSYSPALQGKGGRWTRERLKTFLSNPERFAPGTNMPDPGLHDPKVIDELVKLLEARTESF